MSTKKKTASEVPTKTRYDELVDEGVVTPIEAPAAADTPPAAMIVGDHQASDAEEKVADLVTFAFRLTPAEREEIHAAAGPGKASRFVKAVALAVARLDDKAVQEVTDEVALRVSAAQCS